MQRVLVIGASGTGKSTFAQELGEQTGLPVIHMDQLFWQPNWVQAPREVFIAGNKDSPRRSGSSKASAHRLSTCGFQGPTPSWLQRPRPICYWRIMRRVLTSYGKVRPDMADGCPERFDWEFMKYVWQFPTRYQPRVVEALDRHDARARTVVLRSDAEADAFLRKAAVA